jgi:hypothetical protein
MSQDPAVMSFDGTDKQLLTDPQQLNGYTYARNNPLILVDRSGEKVYLAVRTAAYVGPFKHAYYYIAPESTSRFSGVGPFTLGAAPAGPGAFGNLVTKIGFTSDNNDFEAGLPSDPKFYEELIAKKKPK